MTLLDWMAKERWLSAVQRGYPIWSSKHNAEPPLAAMLQDGVTEELEIVQVGSELPGYEGYWAIKVAPPPVVVTTSFEAWAKNEGFRWDEREKGISRIYDDGANESLHEATVAGWDVERVKVERGWIIREKRQEPTEEELRARKIESLKTSMRKRVGRVKLPPKWVEYLVRDREIRLGQEIHEAAARGDRPGVEELVEQHIQERVLPTRSAAARWAQWRLQQRAQEARERGMEVLEGFHWFPTSKSWAHRTPLASFDNETEYRTEGEVPDIFAGGVESGRALMTALEPVLQRMRERPQTMTEALLRERERINTEVAQQTQQAWAEVTIGSFPGPEFLTGKKVKIAKCAMTEGEGFHEFRVERVNQVGNRWDLFSSRSPYAARVTFVLRDTRFFFLVEVSPTPSPSSADEMVTLTVKVPKSAVRLAIQEAQQSLPTSISALQAVGILTAGAAVQQFGQQEPPRLTAAQIALQNLG